jgi:Fe-S-cluster containining protein
MNHSVRVDPDNCQRCGWCCCDYVASYPGLGMETEYRIPDGLIDQDAPPRPPERGPGYSVTFLGQCRYLIKDGQVWKCRIYNEPERPDCCANYPYETTSGMNCPYIISGIVGE